MNYSIHQVIQKKSKMSQVEPVNSSIKKLLVFDLNEDAPIEKIIEGNCFKVTNEKDTNFFYLNEGALVFDQDVYDSDLFTSFEFAGEVFKLNMEDERDLYLLNLTYCPSLLNSKKSEVGKIYPNHEKEIIKHSFYTNRIDGIQSLFKLPENTSRAIYCTNYAAEHSFYDDYVESEMNGLSFLELTKFRI
jgi:hypothetical protein